LTKRVVRPVGVEAIVSAPAIANACSRTFAEKACVGVEDRRAPSSDELTTASQALRKPAAITSAEDIQMRRRDTVLPAVSTQRSLASEIADAWTKSPRSALLRTGRRRSPHGPPIERRGALVVRFANLRADFKLFACIGLWAAVALLAVGFVAVVQGSIDEELERTLAASSDQSRGVADLYDRFQDLARLRSRAAVDGDPDAKSKTVDAADAHAASVLFDAAIRSAPGLEDRIDRARQSFARMSRSGDRDGARSPVASRLDPGAAPAVLGDDSILEMRTLRDEIDDAIGGRSENALTKAKRARLFLIEALGALLAAASGLTFIALRFGLNVPIQALASALVSTTARAPPPGLDRSDEAGQIARGLEAARAAMSAEMKAHVDRVEQLRRGEADASAAESRMALDGHARTLIQLGAAMKTLAAGDLTVRLGDSLPGDSAPLARDFDSALNLLTKAVLAFGMSADALQSKAHDISTASDDVTHRGEQQLQAVEKAGASLASIATRSNAAADGVAQTRRHAAVLDEEAAKSAVRMKQASETWEIVAKSAEQVNGITALVDEVAFQTTLLALNASVEAARAGDVGRGIAVVALELRALAQRSTQAAREFDAAFSASTAQIRKGAALLSETGASMERIKQGATDIETAVSTIDVGVADQAKDVREARGALDRIGAASKQNAKTAEQVNSASRSVDDLVGKLSCLIERLRGGAAANEAVTEPRIRGGAREYPRLALQFQSKSS
jgi:methyl-accepting chemotaxis protein